MIAYLQLNQAIFFRLSLMPIRFLSITICAVALMFNNPAMAVNSVGDLKKVESDVQSLVEKALPCTVCIRSARGMGSGSGVIVSEDGLVLTAAHVTMAAGEDLIVIFPDGREVKAKSLGMNRSRDAGMVQITDQGPYPFVEVGESKNLKRNDWCISMGHAGGFQADRTPPVRLGRVLANGRFVVSDCAIIGGDSGGPLFDLDGRLIGIHSNIGESLSQNQHVPIDVFQEGWDRMKDGESWGRLLGQRPNPRRPVMGVQLSPEKNDDGVIVGGVTPNAPADQAGLKVRDVITKVNGKSVKSADDIVRYVTRSRPGDRLKLKVVRDDETLDLEVRLIRAGQLMQRERPSRGRPPLEGQTDKAPNEKAPNEKAPNEKEPNESNAGKEKQAGNETELKGRSVEELLRDARRNRGRLNLSKEERERLEEFMQNRFGGFGGFGAPPPQTGPDNWFTQVLDAYEPVVAIASDSTYRVLVDEKQVAFGTAVSKDTLLTKASEIEARSFQVELTDGSYVDGKVLNTFKRYDLALVQVPVENLAPIELQSESQELSLGTFLASVGTSKEPTAIGLISVKSRELESDKGFLGVLLDKVDDGIIIRQVVPRSPARRAGLRPDDIIVKVENETHEELLDMIKSVGSHPPNEEIELLVRRGDEEITIAAKLGRRPQGRLDAMNRMGGELSGTRSGFPLALQHDCPIEPTACGGPLVNLDGEVVGINIARAGRIKTYALPVGVIAELLEAATPETQAAP